MPALTRRRLLAAAGGVVAGGAGGLGYMGLVEPRWLETHVTPVTLPLPEGTGPVRILHLSDLHASPVVPWSLLERAVEIGLAGEPDAIFITGDFITDHLPDAGRYRELLARLSARAPVHAVAGNHDGGGWGLKAVGVDNLPAIRRLCASADVDLMENESLTLDLGPLKLDVVGLADFWGDDFSPAVAFRRLNGSRPTLVLSHNPDSKDRMSGYPWDLMLCGHTHGGQLEVPFLGWTPFAPVRDHRFIKGLHPWTGRQIHITAGVGNLHGMRLNSRPQVSFLDLRSPQPA